MLDMPPGEGYYRSRIPCPEDERVARVVRAFSESSPGRQAVFREAVDGVRAGLLLVFSERMAALAVRMESAQPIVQGLVAASLAQEGDPREALAVPALHRRRAEILGLDTLRLFDEAAGRTDLSGAHWLRDVRDADESPEDVGYEEADDGEGFRYERAVARQPATATTRPRVGSSHVLNLLGRTVVRAEALPAHQVRPSYVPNRGGRRDRGGRVGRGRRGAAGPVLIVLTTPRETPVWHPTRLPRCGRRWPSRPHPPPPPTSSGCPARMAPGRCASTRPR